MVARIYGSLFFCGLFLLVLVACQSDGSAPDASTGLLDGAASCPWDSSVAQVYAANRDRSQAKQACRTIARFVSRGQQDAAEQAINELNEIIYTDYGICVGGVFGTQDLSACRLSGGANVAPAAVVAFVQATCDLAPFLPQSGDVDCVVPLEGNLAQPTAPATDPTAEIAGGWIVDVVDEGGTIVLPNGEFAHQLVDLDPGIASVFVSMRENSPTAGIGICPEDSDIDCVRNNYTTDMDNPDDPIGVGTGTGGLYTEICEGNLAFPDVPARCAGGECNKAANPVDPPLGILSCTKGALDFAPSTWTVADEAPAFRDVVCSVTSQSAAISEGTECRIKLDGGDFLDGKACTTEATGQNTASCTITDVPAADFSTGAGDPVDYVMVAEKQQGTGSHSGESAFSLAQDDPTLGNVEIVEVQVLPSGQQ